MSKVEIKTPNVAMLMTALSFDLSRVQLMWRAPAKSKKLSIPFIKRSRKSMDRKKGSIHAVIFQEGKITSKVRTKIEDKSPATIRPMLKGSLRR